MAKKEYFDKKYKEGKFKWFFQTVGCIPVDRTTKDEFAKTSALEVLKESKALGIFSLPLILGLNQNLYIGDRITLNIFYAVNLFSIFILLNFITY